MCIRDRVGTTWNTFVRPGKTSFLYRKAGTQNEGNPLVLGAGLPVQEGRLPGPDERVPGGAHPRGRLRGQVRGVLRRAPLGHVVQRGGRLPRGVRRPHRRAARRRPDRSAGSRAGPGAEPGRAGLMATQVERAPGLVASRSPGRAVISWVTSTDHKTIGYMYLVTSFAWFGFAGVLALLMRAELFEPGMQVVQSAEQYDQLFTMHGTIMLLLFATPLFAGFANVIMPLQIGAPD